LTRALAARSSVAVLFDGREPVRTFSRGVGDARPFTGSSRCWETSLFATFFHCSPAHPRSSNGYCAASSRPGSVLELLWTPFLPPLLSIQYCFSHTPPLSPFSFPLARRTAFLALFTFAAQNLRYWTPLPVFAPLTEVTFIFPKLVGLLFFLENPDSNLVMEPSEIARRSYTFPAGSSPKHKCHWVNQIAARTCLNSADALFHSPDCLEHSRFFRLDPFPLSFFHGVGCFARLRLLQPCLVLPRFGLGWTFLVPPLLERTPSPHPVLLLGHRRPSWPAPAVRFACPSRCLLRRLFSRL